MIREELAHLVVPIGDVANHPRNVRQGDIGAICESLKEHGQYRPIVVQRSTGYVLAGNHTLKAATALGWDQIAVTYVECDDDRALRILLADNRTNDLASYDDAALAELLKELADTEAGLAGTMFNGDDLDDLLQVVDTATLLLGDPDEIPDDAPAITSLGDVWLLGDHRLMCGDSTDPTDMARLMNGKKAVLVHADPPYGMGKQKEGVLNDNLYEDKLDRFQTAWWTAARPFVEDNGSVYVWGNAPDLWRWWCSVLSNTERLTFRNEIVWDKSHAQGIRNETSRGFATVTERCLFFMLGQQGFNNNADNYWEGWEPIRSYLEGEMRKCGWTTRDLNRITGTVMAGHWVTTSQWQLITQDNYRKIQEAARDHDAFKRDHDELKRDHDELKRDHDELKQAFYDTRAHFDNTHDNMTDVWNFPRVTGAERHGHATPKPVAIMERAIKSSTPTNGLVLEPFGGSGSTLVAAHQTGRTAYLMELDPHYCDVICKRFQRLTGITPIAEATSKPQTFWEVS